MQMTPRQAVVAVVLDIPATQTESLYSQLMTLMDKTGLDNNELRGSFPDIAELMDGLFHSGAFEHSNVEQLAAVS